MRRHTSWLTAPVRPISRSATSSARSPPAFAPGGEAGTLGAQCGVVAVAGVDDGGVVVDVEHPGRDVIEQLLEITGLPRLADAPGKYARVLNVNTATTERVALYARISQDT